MARILLVDDDKTTFELVKRLLEGQGLEVVTAQTAEEALLKLKSNKPDLILTDVVMPGMGGFGLVKELKNNEAMKGVPIVVFSARGKMRDTLEGLGVDHILAKPIETEALFLKITALLPDVKLTPPAKPETPPPQEPAPAAAETPSQEQPVAANPSASSENKPAQATPQETTPPEAATQAPAQEPKAPAPEKEKAPEPPASAAAETPTASPVQATKKILLVGQDKSVVDKIALLLKRRQCSSLIVSNSKEVSARIKEFDPQIIIVDLMLSDVPSKEVVKQIRRSSQNRKKMVLTFSCLDKVKMEETAYRKASIELEGLKGGCMDVGAEDYLGVFEETKFIALLEPYLQS